VTKTDADDAKKKSTANAAIPYKYSDEDTIQIDDSRKYLDIKPKNDGSDESDEESEVDFGKHQCLKMLKYKLLFNCFILFQRFIN